MEVRSSIRKAPTTLNWHLPSFHPATNDEAVALQFAVSYGVVEAGVRPKRQGCDMGGVIPGSVESAPNLSSFAAGLFRPSMTAVCVALATFVAIFVAFVLTITPSFMASDRYRYLLSDDQDVSTMVTHRVFSAVRSGKPSILYFGDSAAIRCIESEDGLASLVQERTGKTFIVHDLASNAQSTWVMAALAQTVPPQPGGVIVIAFTPDILGIGARDSGRISLQAILKWPMVGIYSPVLADEARRAGLKPPLSSGVYAIDQAAYILSRRKALARNVIFGPPHYGDSLNAPWYAHVGTPEFHAEEHRLLPHVAALYDHSASENFAVIERMIIRARKSGPVHVVIMMAPMNPGWNDDPFGRAYFARYRRDLEAFAHKIGGSFASATDLAGLRQADFVDFEGHINNAGARKRCVTGLANAISKTVAGDL